MARSITPNQIRRNNRNLIYLYTLKHPGVSQQDISYELRLSRPTVTANLTELEETGMIIPSGQIDTELVGRKATAYSAVADYRVSIAADIHSSVVKLIAVNLKGENIKRVVHSLPYKNSAEYQLFVCSLIKEFISSLSYPPSRILGVGIAMPGLVSPDGTSITYGKILDCTGLTIDLFQRELPYPCRFFHDSDSAATSELWASPQLIDALYLQIGIHVGAAMIKDKKIVIGKHGHNATIEHITIEENGKPCYCGHRGCVDTIISLEALTADTPVETFFERVRLGEKAEKKRFDSYLRDLAKVISRLHLFYDKDFIIGGEIASYLEEQDITKLNALALALSPFHDAVPYIFLSKMPKHNVTIGAALPYIQEFLTQEEII